METSWLKDKVVLVTGGTGSFGNAVIRRFVNSDVKEIRIFSRDEKKQDDMRQEYKEPRLKFYLGDVRDSCSIDGAMQGVNYVFSAAALKQVPSCEFYPLQAVYTNIIGTENTLTSAIKNKVQSVIVLSTDKAVYPINAMGMSKALMEKVATAKARQVNSGQTMICTTRYGNVMASRGSVIPLFVQQIKSKNSITITDPGMTRFMMALDDAVDLVIFAYNHGKGGDVFVQKSPAATIEQLAKVLIEIFDAKSDIQVIGTRHGEKKHESLLNREEMCRAEDLGNYYRVDSDQRDLNYSLYFDEGETSILRHEDYTSNNTHRLSNTELKELLLSLEYIQRSLRF